MSKYDKGDSQIDGQMSLEHLYDPEEKLDTSMFGATDGQVRVQEGRAKEL